MMPKKYKEQAKKNLDLARQEFPPYKEEIIARYGTAQERKIIKDKRAESEKQLMLFLAHYQGFLDHDFKIPGLVDIARSGGFRIPIQVEWNLLVQKTEEFFVTGFLPGINHENNGDVSGVRTYQLHYKKCDLGTLALFNRDEGLSEIYISGVPEIPIEFTSHNKLVKKDHAYGMSVRTEYALKNLLEMRSNAIRDNRLIPTKATAMPQAGITDKTWKKYAPKLYANWHNKQIEYTHEEGRKEWE